MTPAAMEWLDLAVVDYNVAKHLNDTFYPKPLEIICYHCQQAAEKALKSLIIELGCEGGLPKLHDLSFLLKQVKNKVNIDEKFYDYADELTPYGVAVRYPSELFLEDHHAERAIAHADAIITWVKSM